MKNILISLCLALFIISASVTITLNFRPLYYHDISSLKIEETSGFSKKVIRENYDAFTMFHEIMFRNDYWIFDEATDPVIMILPDAFFLHCAVMIILLILIGSLLCMRFRSFFRHRFML